MSEPYRALIAILGLSIAFLWSIRTPITWFAMESSNFRVRAGLWLVLTFLLFVAHSFWLYAIAVVSLIWTAGRRDTNQLGLFCFLFLLAPPFRSVIQGFGGIRQFLDLDYLRLSIIAILLPCSLRLLGSQAAPWWKMPADKYVLGFIAVQLVVLAPATSTTNLMRSALGLFIDVLVPYYAFSRAISSPRQMRDVFAAFTCAAGLLACVGVFEALKGWLLYSTVPDALGISWGYGRYQMRDGSLRAIASSGHSIVFGYILMVGLGLHLALRSAYPSDRSWYGMLLLLVAGVMASGSRGPWVGTAVLLTVATVAGHGAATRIGKAIGMLLLAALVVAFTPWGAKFVSLLPFIGDYDEGSVDYRQQLFSTAWRIFLTNPWLGTPNYLANATMQDLRQGEGIIDLVNSYVSIGLSTGFVGLSMFAGIFVPNAWRIWSSLRMPDFLDEHTSPLARSLLAALAGVGVTIATVSGDLSVGLIYWSLAGMTAALVHMTRDRADHASALHPGSDWGRSQSEGRRHLSTSR